MVNTKQTARREQETLERAKFPPASKDKKKKKKKDKKKEPQPGTSSMSDQPMSPGRIQLGTMDVDSQDSQTWPDADTLVPPKNVRELQETITLPRQVSIKGMHPSFVKYYREYGMTPLLMHGLMTKRGWTEDMINRLVTNCNKAWGTSIELPSDEATV